MSSAVAVDGSQSPWIQPGGGAIRELDSFFALVAFLARSSFAVLIFDTSAAVVGVERSRTAWRRKRWRDERKGRKEKEHCFAPRSRRFL